MALTKPGMAGNIKDPDRVYEFNGMILDKSSLRYAGF